MYSSHSVLDGAGRLAALFLLLPLVLTCESSPTGPGKSVIGVAGGAASLADGAVVLDIPAGALSKNVKFTAAPASSFPPSDLVVPGSVFEVGPVDVQFSHLATLTLAYDPTDLPEGVREQELGLLQVVGDHWEPVPNPATDLSGHTVSGRVESLGRFGAVGLSVAQVDLSLSFYALEQGRTRGITAVGKAASGATLPARVLAWSSSDESVATVDEDGVVTGVEAGTAIISATVGDVAGHAEIVVWSCSDQPQIPESECQALIDFFDTGNVDEWRFSPGWIHFPAPCGWAGVQCTEGSVTRLSYGFKPMGGSLSSHLADLPKLTYLSLGGANLSGPIPASLGALAELSFLNLSGNSFSGELPASLGNLSRLTHLNLLGNELSGPIPPELGQLSSLESLTLSGNQFSGSLPPELGNLSSLKELRILANPLSGVIPPELGNLSNLESLSLGFSPFSGSLPAELGNLSRLTSLGITNTEIAGSIPPEFGNLTNLENITLAWNLLSGPVPLSLAQLGGQIQAREGGSANCRFVPGNDGLTIPDTQEYRDADQNGDGKICSLTIGGG